MTDNLHEEDTREPIATPQNHFPWVLVLILLMGIALGLAAYFYRDAYLAPTIVAISPEPTAVPTPIPTMAPTPIATIIEEPPSQPIAVVEQNNPALPNLNESDAALKDQLLEKNGQRILAELLTPEEVIRKFVRATYNISKGNIVTQYRPVNGPDSGFKAQAIGKMAEVTNPKKADESLQTAVFKNPPKNQARYDVYRKIMQTFKTETLVELYELYYPLLQQAYGELGEGPEQFHTVMKNALAKVLATPSLEKEPELILISVQYQFLDPQLEALPNAQKALLRMGLHNREAILAELEQLLTALQASSP